VRDDQAGAGTGAFGPEDDVEIDHARPPAAAGAAAEVALDPLEAGEQGRGGERAVEDRRGIGEAAAGGAERGRRADPREPGDAERRGGGADRGRGAAVAAGAVGAEGDGVKRGWDCYELRSP
jgi:hypothetical protein